MTAKEQLGLFNSLPPKEFISFCIDMEERGYQFSICWYVKVCLKEKTGELLSQKEIAIKEKCKNAYADIDWSPYQGIIKEKMGIDSFQTTEDLKLVLKDSYSGIKNGIKRYHNPDNSKDHSAFLELIEAHINNLDFIKEDKPHRKIKRYNSHKNRELYELIETFECREYQLGAIAIKLTPKCLMHISLGHIESYKIPRKGKLIQFTHIKDWKFLIKVIDYVINLLKEELNVHYNNPKKGYDKMGITIADKKYGIHIDKNGYIKTFYQVD